MLIYLWTHYRRQMRCQRGFVITSAVAGSALIAGFAAATTATAAGAAIAAGTIGAITAGAIYTGAYFALNGLMGGDDTPDQIQTDEFDPYAEQKKSESSAKARTKRTRVAVARNETNLTRGAVGDAKLGTTGLMGA